MAPLLLRNRFRVPSTRLRGWDYRWPGAYAVTICVKGRVCCLGEVVEEDVALSPYGVIAAEEWLTIPSMHPQVILDEWIVMPDQFSWQERFFDQILRDDEDLERYRAYIRENPIRWRPPTDGT